MDGSFNTIQDKQIQNPIPQPPVESSVSVKSTVKFSLILLVVVGFAIVGYFASAYYFTLWPFPSPNSVVPIFTPRPSATTTVLDTSAWKTYRNEEYGFEFKYPRTWKRPYDAAGPRFYLHSPSDTSTQAFNEGLTVLVKDNSGLDLASEREKLRRPHSDVIRTETVIAISEMTGYQYNSSAGYDKTVLIQYKNKLYYIELLAISEEVASQLDLILSTFRLLN